LLRHDIDNQLNNHSFSRTEPEQRTYTRVSLKPYWYTGSNNYANINIPPAFIQELDLTIDDEVTIEIITTSDGRKGILLLKREGQGQSTN